MLPELTASARNFEATSVPAITPPARLVKESAQLRIHRRVRREFLFAARVFAEDREFGRFYGRSNADTLRASDFGRPADGPRFSAPTASSSSGHTRKPSGAIVKDVGERYAVFYKNIPGFFSDHRFT